MMETITSEQPTVPADAGQADAARSRSCRAARRCGRRSRPGGRRSGSRTSSSSPASSSPASSTSPHESSRRSLTFVSFCLISSAGYFVNDLIDVELDRKHPKKRFRPLAAGELSEGAAKTIAPALAVVAIGLAFATVNWEVGLMVVGYGVAQVAYSLGLKQIVIVDVMTLAGLFILRVAAGASAVDAHASEWLILCTGMIAALPRLHQAPPGGGLRATPGDQHPPRPRALLAALPRPDGRPGHHRDRDQLLDLHRQLAADRQPDDVDDPARSSTASSATST